MSNVMPPRMPNDPVAIEVSRVSGTHDAGFSGLADAMSLIEDLGRELDNFYSKQRDLNRQQQTLVQHTSIVKVYQVFEEKQESAKNVMKASQNNAMAGIVSGALSMVGTMVAGVGAYGTSSGAKFAAAGGQHLGAGTGTMIENIVKSASAETERDASTLSNTANLKQAGVDSLNKTADDAQAAGREASAKLGENMRAINDILSGFLSHTSFK